MTIAEYVNTICAEYQCDRRAEMAIAIVSVLEQDSMDAIYDHGFMEGYDCGFEDAEGFDAVEEAPDDDDEDLWVLT